MAQTVQRHVVCVGDSLTRAQVSTDYLAILRARTATGHFRFTNAGVNGDLAFNVLERLDNVIELQPDMVTVLIGTNDAKSSLTDKNTRKFIKMKKLPTRPTIEWYRVNLTAIVERLADETAARVALLSLPVLGELIGSASVNRSALHSSVIREVAQAHHLAYLPCMNGRSNICSQRITGRVLPSAMAGGCRRPQRFSTSSYDAPSTAFRTGAAWS